MIQSRGFLGRLPGPLLKTGLPLIKKAFKPLAKSLLILLGLTVVAAADAGIHKKILGSGHGHSSSALYNHPSSATLIISNNEIEDIIKIVKSLEDSGLLLKGVTETVQNEAKEQKRGFLSMLLGTLGVRSLGNILTGPRINRAGEGIVRDGYGNSKKKVKKTTKWIFDTASSFNQF